MCEIAILPSTLESCDVGNEARLRPLFRSATLSANSWRCLHDGPFLRSERCSPQAMLTLVHQGVFELHNRGRTEVIDPTTVVLHEPMSPYSTSHPYGCGDFGCHIILHPGLLSEIYRSLGKSATMGSPRLHVGRGPARALALLSVFRRLPKTERGDGLAAEETLVELAGEVIRGLLQPADAETPGKTSESTATRRDHRELAEATRTLLARRFQEPLSLSDIARAVHSSPYHLSRVFRRYTGLPIHRYRTQLRLRAALEPAIDQRTDLSRLAFDLGFSSHSHFTATFRRGFGLTPRQLRRLASGQRVRELRRALSG